MNKIKFPLELTIFADRINDNWFITLQRIIEQNQKIKTDPTLNDWYQILIDIFSKKGDIPSEIWSMGAKLAWVLGETDFFSNYYNQTKAITKDPIFLCYFGAGLAEFIDFKTGFKLIKDGISLALSSSGNYAVLFDVLIPYILVLHNSDNIQLLKEFSLKINKIFEEELNSDARYNYLMILLNMFTIKEDELRKRFTNDELLRIVRNSKDLLATSLFYTLFAKWDTKTSFMMNMEVSVENLKKINARFRLVIAYTNIASFYASKADYKFSLEYLDRAFTLIDELSKKNKYSYGVSIHALIQKGSIFIDQGKLEEAKEIYQLALEKASKYNSINYQLKVHLSLAYLSFLLMQYDSALKHISTVIKLIDEITNIENRYVYRLKCVDLLIDLNKLNEVEKIQLKMTDETLKGCLKAYYEYVKGKYELKRHNLGLAEDYFEQVITMVDQCPHIRSTLLFTISEAYIQEYRLSEDIKFLQKAQKMIEDGLKGLKDIPTLMKGRFLLAFLLTVQEHYEEAEDILDTIVSSSNEIIPHFRDLAEKLLENIHDIRLTRATISPITNFKDIIRYLRDAKTTIDSQPR